MESVNVGAPEIIVGRDGRCVDRAIQQASGPPAARPRRVRRMADDEVVLQGSEGGARIRLHSAEYVDAADGERVLDSVTIAVECPRVEFSARATSCVLAPLSTYQLDELLGGFATVAEPWTYEPAWSAETQGAGFVHLRGKCDRLGHVRLSVEVEDYGIVEWKATAHVVFDLGQSESLGNRIRALIRS